MILAAVITIFFVIVSAFVKNIFDEKLKSQPKSQKNETLRKIKNLNYNQVSEKSLIKMLSKENCLAICLFESIDDQNLA